MSWTTPKTNWQSGDFFSYVDYNRITGNIEYLYTEIGETPTGTYTVMDITGYLLAPNYNPVSADVINLYNWLGLSDVYDPIEWKDIYSMPWTSKELNAIEGLLGLCKTAIDNGVEPINRIYCGDETYSNDILI